MLDEISQPHQIMKGLESHFKGVGLSTQREQQKIFIVIMLQKPFQAVVWMRANDRKQGDQENVAVKKMIMLMERVTQVCGIVMCQNQQELMIIEYDG